MSEKKTEKKKEKGSPGCSPTYPPASNRPSPAHLALVVYLHDDKQLGGRHAEAADDGQATQLPPCLLQHVQDRAVVALVTLPPFPLALAHSAAFPLLPREHPPFAAVRNRSQRWREAWRPCPSCAPSSTSSIWRSWRTNRARGQ